MARSKNSTLVISGTPAARRREAPLVVVQLGGTDVRQKLRIVQEARKAQWRILDLDVYQEKKLPSGLTPAGAFLE